MNAPVFPELKIPNTIAAGPGPGNTSQRVLDAYYNQGVADHMNPDVIRGMIEAKKMLREIWGTNNVHTFGVAGTGWSGLDMMFSVVHPGEKIVLFVNGTFSGIDELSVRMKGATEEELQANSLDPKAASVITVKVPHGQSVSGEIVEKALGEHKPKWAAMAHWETGSGRVNDIRGFSDACEKHGVLGLVDAVSSLGIAEFRADDYPGIHGWASCPQKGVMALPLTYSPVTFSDTYIEELKKVGGRSFAHHPILEARHWSIIEGQDVEKGSYHRTHSPYAVASFHEALRMVLEEGMLQRAERYRTAEKALNAALTKMGCTVTSNMTSLLVLDLPEQLHGQEKDFVAKCRAENFCIWPTLSEPTQIRVGILNLLKEEELTEITRRFGDMLNRHDCKTDVDAAVAELKRHLQ
ncbi:aminotransferase class V-fold PLP-dependent enzyme [Fulvimarina endophytica]|uniref:Aminotransferase class V-fold PLP-dependent enzyme n=1 Tax=Fulvimarina endophytica TaxID=2293836 RepID=A0A371XAL3_9HYPH|nr:aminotransferase class V-fold PLP-dependent enzyme [Fulvimarina endophytica]RFC66266.1 aminotransferase class V-fold PLP-dependent enzyme [Fulvimarina endophytica]